jgi:hypothetical protein
VAKAVFWSNAKFAGEKGKHRGQIKTKLIARTMRTANVLGN